MATETVCKTVLLAGTAVRFRSSPPPRRTFVRRQPERRASGLAAIPGEAAVVARKQGAFREVDRPEASGRRTTPAQSRTKGAGNRSGYSSAWQSAAFGTQRSQVRILLARPSKAGWRNRLPGPEGARAARQGPFLVRQSPGHTGQWLRGQAARRCKAAGREFDAPLSVHREGADRRRHLIPDQGLTAKRCESKGSAGALQGKASKILSALRLWAQGWGERFGRDRQGRQLWALSSVGRAPHLQCGGRRFETGTVHHRGWLGQVVWSVSYADKLGPSPRPATTSPRSTWGGVSSVVRRANATSSRVAPWRLGPPDGPAGCNAPERTTKAIDNGS